MCVDVRRQIFSSAFNSVQNLMLFYSCWLDWMWSVDIIGLFIIPPDYQSISLYDNKIICWTGVPFFKT